MATRRRYKVRAEGGRADLAADAPVMAAAPTVAPAEPISAPGDESPLAAQLAAAQRAEELHRQQAQQQPNDPMAQLAAHIDGLPISDHKKNFLRAHPDFLFPPLHQLMAKNYQIALQAGVPDDSAAMDRAVIMGMQHDIDQRRQLQRAAVEHARPQAAPEQPMQQPSMTEQQPTVPLKDAGDLATEAKALYDELYGEEPAPTPAPRRSIPMSAPVSREAPMASGGRTSRADNTLSHDERQIAAVSFPHLPKAQAEYAYLQNRKLMREMKADGRIQGDQ